MIHRGGGVVNLLAKVIRFDNDFKELAESTLNRSDMLVVELIINVCDSMGANAVNTVCEKIAPTIQEVCGGRVGLRILSNLCIYRKAGAEFRIPCQKLSNARFSGNHAARLLMEAYLFAVGDIFRAATHNKGIMNGVDAVALATGQDWRAVESAAHSFASIGKYKPLTTYRIVEDKEGIQTLVGRLEMPLSVGTRGGATHSNPLYIQNLELLKNPTSSQLAEIMVCVGLAQNFAALRALSQEGIQKGHMKLHARNIAISAGIPLDRIEDAVKYLIDSKDISEDRARQFILENKGKLGNLF
jgi:degradative hydroxymethylglutaryl-CoA reductase